MELDRILRTAEILQVTGVSNATIWRWIKTGSFPAPLKLGPQAVGWRESALREWLESREPAVTVFPESSHRESPTSHGQGGQS
jgi:prophage regulatory protein